MPGAAQILKNKGALKVVLVKFLTVILVWVYLQYWGRRTHLYIYTFTLLGPCAYTLVYYILYIVYSI